VKALSAAPFELSALNSLERHTPNRYGKIMNLAQFPRRRYTPGQTPIEKLPRFSKAIGGPDIIPRDKHPLKSSPASPRPSADLIFM